MVATPTHRAHQDGGAADNHDPAQRAAREAGARSARRSCRKLIRAEDPQPEACPLPGVDDADLFGKVQGRTKDFKKQDFAASRVGRPVSSPVIDSP